jgi:hypothetical protein
MGGNQKEIIVIIRFRMSFSKNGFKKHYYYEKTAPKFHCVPKFKSDAEIGKISRFCSGII